MYTTEFIDREELPLEELIKKFKIARYMYRNGMPILSDDEYDELYTFLSIKVPDLGELNQVYELDEEPKLSDLIDAGITQQQLQKIQNIKKVDIKELPHDAVNLIDQDNLGIVSYKTYEDTLQAIRELGVGKYVATPKIDGLFTSTIYERIPNTDKFKILISLTRGGASDGYDITDIAQERLPKIIQLKNEKRNYVKMKAEAYVNTEDAKKIGYLNQRSACIGILSSRVERKIEQYKYVNFICHGSDTSEDYLEALDTYEEQGFDVVPRFIIEIIPKHLGSVEEFRGILNTALSQTDLWKNENKIYADGTVLVNIDSSDTLVNTTANKMHANNVIAVKIKEWVSGVYTSKILRIGYVYGDSEIAYKLHVEPVIARNGNTLSVVTNINLKTLIDNSIKIGDTIEFEYNNETSIKFIRKVEL